MKGKEEVRGMTGNGTENGREGRRKGA